MEKTPEQEMREESLIFLLSSICFVYFSESREARRDSRHEQGSKRLAKVRLSFLQGLFLICRIVLSLFFCDSGIFGHFRGARSGVYIVED